MKRVPAYKTVYLTLKGRIKDGTYPIASLLPTETEIEQEFNVSRTTVRRATAILASEGYIRVVQGKGSEVLSPQSTQQLNCVSSITETLRNRGYDVTSRNMRIDLIVPPPNVAEALALSKQEKVYLVKRIQCIDGMPLVVMNNYIRQSVAPDIDHYSGKFVSLYNFLEEHYHVVFKEAKEFLSATAADFMESIELEIPVGSPLLCSRRITSGDGGMIECSINKIVADKYEYCVYLKGR